MKKSDEPQGNEEAVVGIGASEMPFLRAGADLGNLYYAHYQLHHLKESNERSVGLEWTPSEDDAMVRASVEVSMDDYLDVEDPETETASSASVSASGLSVGKPASSTSTSGLSASKSDKTSITAASSECHAAIQSKFSLAQRYAISVAAHPKRHLYSTLLVCAILTIAAVVGAVLTEATFEIQTFWFTRGTLIASRGLQAFQVKKINEKEVEFFMNDGQRVDINDPPANEVVCSGQWYGSPYMIAGQQLNLMTAWKTRDDSQNALDSEALYQMCMNEEHVLESLEENDLCYKCPVEGGSKERCIQPYSLATVARLYLQALSTWSTDLNPDIYLAPSLSCEDLRAAWTEPVQSRFTSDLLDCTNSLLEQYDLQESGNGSPMCVFPDANMVASLVDVNFPRSGRVEYTTAIYASKHDTDSVDELYKLDKSNAYSQEGTAMTGVYEVGFQPLFLSFDGGFYMRDLYRAVPMDLALFAVACAVTGSLFFWHTKSLFLTLFGLLQIILALPISWALYTFVLGLESFPIINLGGVFIVFSLGADDVYVMSDKWKSTRAIMTRASTTEVAIKSLPSAITATLMTSFTTSIGFFATNVSDIVCIKLFGTFCGLLIAVDYVLSVLLLSPVLCLYDIMMMRNSPSQCVSRKKMKVVKENASSDSQEVVVGAHRNLRDRILGSYSDLLYSFRWPVLLVSVSTIIASSFVSSTFKPPEKQPFPAPFRTTNPYEAHSKFLENLVAFHLQLATDPRWTVQAVFGVQPVDDQNLWDTDPNYIGSMAYDDDFDAANNQLYLLEFCDKIDKPTQDYRCVLQEFDSWLQMQSQSGSPDDQYIINCDSESSVPTESDTFDQCFIAFSELTNSSAVTFDYETSKVKTITIDTRIDSTLWSPTAEIDKDWRLTEEWSIAERSRAPEGANNFFISSMSFWYLDSFNNIVTSALEAIYIVVSCAALVILLSSRSLTLSLFSGISILYVLAAATASLAGLGWSLGIFEATLLAIVVGLGSDFIMHFAHAYSMIPGKANKRVRMKHAILHMGPSVLGSAATTISTAIIMQFCEIQSISRFATMMIMTMIHSLIGSFVIFSVLCSCFGPEEPTKRFDAIKTRIQEGNGAGEHSEEDVPRSIEIAIDTDVNNGSSFRPKRGMIFLCYLLAATIIFVISFGAYQYSFVKSSREPQIVEKSAFAAVDPGDIVDKDENYDYVMSKLAEAVILSSKAKDRIPELPSAEDIAKIQESVQEAVNKGIDQITAAVEEVLPSPSNMINEAEEVVQNMLLYIKTVTEAEEVMSRVEGGSDLDLPELLSAEDIAKLQESVDEAVNEVKDQAEEVVQNMLFYINTVTEAEEVMSNAINEAEEIVQDMLFYIETVTKAEEFMSRAGGGRDLGLPELLSAEDIAKIQESVDQAVNKGNDQITVAVEEVLRLPSNTINEAEEVVQNMLLYIETVTEAEEFMSNAINEAEEVVQDMLFGIKTVTEAEEVMSNAINEAEEVVQNMLFYIETVTEVMAKVTESVIVLSKAKDRIPELPSAEDIAKIQESVEEAVNMDNDQITAAVEEVLRLPSNTINEAAEVVQNMLLYIKTVTEAEEVMSRVEGGSDLDLPELLSAEDIAKIQESVEEAVNKGNDQIAAAVEEVLPSPSNTINEAEEVVQDMLFFMKTVTEAEAEEFMSRAGGGSDLDLPELLSAEDITNEKVAANMIKAP